MKIRQLAAIAAFTATSATAGTAMGQQRTPASFAFNGADVARAIDQNSVPTGNLHSAIYCQTLVTAKGTGLNTQCFDKSANVSLVKAIETIVRKQDFNAATVDGETVAVRMNYRVVYQQDATSQSALLVPNLGSLQNELGLNYVEPQEIVADGWFNKLGLAASSGSPFFAANKQFLRAKATVSATGNASNAIMIDSVARSQAKLITQSIEQAEFVPGHVDGKATDMKYLAVVSQ